MKSFQRKIDIKIIKLILNKILNLYVLPTSRSVPVSKHFQTFRKF